MKPNDTLPQIYLVRHGETAWTLSGQATGRTDIALTARWLRLPAVEARNFYLTTASVSILGYHHDLDEPVIRLRNDARRG